MTIYTMPQRTPEWFAIRAGKLSGSNAAKVLAKGKGSAEAVTRRDYRYKLMAERLTGMPQDDDVRTSEAMQHGIDKEADAIAAYEQRTGAAVRLVGFVGHDELLAGCSPDGLVGADGVIEVKCPKTSTHLTYWDSGGTVLVEDYLPQVLHALWITERAWCDMVSFDDRLPEHLRLVIRRVERTAVAAELSSYELMARRFLAEVAVGVVQYAERPAVVEVV